MPQIHTDCRVKLLIWDLDGTLVNSLPLTFAAFNAGLKPFLGRELSPQEIMGYFGPPDQEILRTLVGTRHAEECYNLMLEHFCTHLHMLEFHEGILFTLAMLSQASYSHAVFTGRGKKSTQVILDHLDALKHFACIVTNDDVTQYKPHPEGIFKICHQLGVTPQETYMIGDAPGDIQAGQSAGCGTISCLWDHYAKHETLTALNPHHLVQHPVEILKLIEFSNSRFKP